MHRLTPPALLLTLALLPAAAAFAAPGKAKPAHADAPSVAFAPDPAQVQALAQAQFTIRKDRAIAFTGEPPAVLDKDLLEKADVVVTDSGTLVTKSSFVGVDKAPIEPQTLVKILQGLLPFARAKSLDPAEVGKALRQWGVPEQFDGRHLMNPDGTATYYGVMFYEGMRDKQDSVRRVSGERLAASLELFDSAYAQAFDKDAPDLGVKDLQRAWAMLGQSKDGETPLTRMNGAAYVSPSDWGALAAKKKGDAAAIAALNQLAKTRYHQDRSLAAEPPEPKDPKNAPRLDPPSQLSLAGLLAALDKLNGRPLSADQQEWLVKSFPMGETVWRMGAPTLWRAGLTGKDVKVAVLDTGAGFSPDIDARVKARENLTRERTIGAIGDHATHVTGTILALAPDAEIRSYRVLNGGDRNNPRRALEEDEIMTALAQAVDKAVADGNQVINMSLGGSGRPSGPLNEQIRKYAEQGIVFVIAAGNGGRAGATGVESPGDTPNVITAGSLDVNGRYSRYSSFGSVWDPANASYLVKKIFMAPGQNINSSAPATADEPDPHQLMNGTSMATPHISGVATLLVQQALALGKDKKAAGKAVVQALDDSSPLMSARDLAPDVPPDQDFVVVDPIAAYQRLRAGAPVPATAK